MIAVDTNVLVRVFVDDKDNQTQNQLVRNLLKSKHVYVSQIVLVELIWVLESAYDYKKADVLYVLDILENTQAYHIENPNQFSHALELYQSANADFSDYLIFANSQGNDHEFWTFDKKLAKTAGVNHLKT